MFHQVRLVEHDEIIAKQNPALDLFFQRAQQGEEKRVIQHQDVGRENPFASALEKTHLGLFGEVGLIAAGFW